MNRYLKPCNVWVCLLGLLLSPAVATADCCPAHTDGEKKHNTLTEQEATDGWELLFDGKSLDRWRGYQMDELPEGWVVQDGAIARHDQGEWRDLITKDEFDNFELTLEWKISEDGNSGIMFNVVEDYNQTYDSGPEMQVLDNTKHNDGKNTLTSAGSAYALYAPAQEVTQPVGEFNKVLIRVIGNHVEHYLNGEKIVEYEMYSDEWNARVEASKFKDMPGYAKSPVGHIALQDHGDDVWYRDIKIRRLNDQGQPINQQGSDSHE